MTITKIPPAELKVMKFIWSSDFTVTSKDVIEAMEKLYDWKQTTTLTLLSRLVNKKFLSARKIDRHTHYTVLIGEEEYLHFETKTFLDNMHGSSIESFMKSLFKKGVNEDELNSVEEWVKNIKKDE
ncbi:MULTISPECIES: BlaI/MecI/CopY family transcriptional regulator [unclassified Clostridioides]|uniref:BlaI/MecI/CopY family transcriptional regulator n=1 Tax=unclassified Clostridioides TaxID=2635829 RepID=UPI0006BBF16B|nr:beta-lactamase [Clostridioides difficile]MCC0693613.1 BlaI/MecI/CopY family transcriptional regulator [Clostridioides sp. ZZV14-6387]KPI51947.1 beta-lactamase [Clostridioides difficile]MCI9976406.1 BlaI/MecI/CopY family transcriptional regulator [Clostridioides difficile]MDB3085441.1 transcriptional regulator [Clostridioides difficile]